jgi:hypothetical protein
MECGLLVMPLKLYSIPGIKTDLIRVTIVAGDDIEGYDPAQDSDLYEYYLYEERNGE